MRSFFLPNWSPPDDPARPLPAEGRPWPSGDNDDVLGDDEDPISPVAPFDDKKSALRKSASRAVTKHC